MSPRSLAICCLSLALGVPALAAPPESAPPPRSIPAEREQTVTAIDLASALRLAGIENPDILLAQQRVVEAVAIRQLAAAQILPSLNAGLNFDNHTGVLQQSSGRLIKTDRGALYVGAGANAVAAGTVNIPGIVYNLNVSDSIFGFLEARQNVERQQQNSLAMRNEMLRRVAVAYLELLHAEGLRSVALRIRNDAAEVARLTNEWATAGAGRRADAERAATELARRDEDLVARTIGVRVASAELAALLNLDATLRLQPNETRLVPEPVVPDPIPLCELLAMALVQRPELAAQQAAIRQSLLALRAAQLLPFSPNVIFGYSAGTFGGGSNLAAITGVPRFDKFGPRTDLDAIMYWQIQNLGLGNRALIRAADSRLSQEQIRRLAVLNQVREEVSSAFARTHTAFAQIVVFEKAVQSGEAAYVEDAQRVRGNVGLPLELLESLRLLADAHYGYLDSIVAYNRAQIDLYVALGQPPADMLARPVPTAVPPPKKVK
jgi:outer membrane protein TolC